MLFECKKVSFGYENQQVIKDLSFQVQEGEYVWHQDHLVNYQEVSSSAC